MSEVFFVTTHGWSGSSWLANVLNSHSDIFCSHLMYDRVPGKDDGEAKLERNNLFDAVRKESVNRLNTPVNEMIVKINQLTNASYRGNVGLYRMRDLPMLVEKFGPLEHRIRVINLIRDPVSVVFSGFGQFQKRFRFDLHELHWNLGKLLNYSYEYINNLRKKYGIDLGDTKNLCFLAAAQTMASLRLDVEAEPYVENIRGVEFFGHCKMEQITTEKESFSELIKGFLPGLGYSDDYLVDSLGTGPINRHHQYEAVTAQDRFEALEDWQKDAIIHFWKLNELHGFYTSQGYKFEYLDHYPTI